MLRDRLVCGINDEHTQRRLLSEPTLTFKKALEVAQGLEMAAKNARTLQPKAGLGTATSSESAEQSVFNVNPPLEGGQVVSCYRCGRNNHTATKCRIKEAKCHGCGKVGHIIKMCQSRPASGFIRERHTGSIKWVEGEEDRDLEYSLFQLKSPSRSAPLEVSVKLDGHQANMEVDMGASLSIISEATYRDLWATKDKVFEETTIPLRTYSWESLKVLGRVEVEVLYKEQKAQLPLIVVAGEGPSLLGRNWLEHLRLDWKEIHRLQGDSLQTVLARHSEVFQVGLGTMRGYKATIDVDPKASPRFCKAR